jgi:hypothetical protein
VCSMAFGGGIFRTFTVISSSNFSGNFIFGVFRPIPGYFQHRFWHALPIPDAFWPIQSQNRPKQYPPPPATNGS